MNTKEHFERGDLACKVRDNKILAISPGGYTCKEKVAHAMGPH
jgi:hypothetical protein